MKALDKKPAATGFDEVERLAISQCMMETEVHRIAAASQEKAPAGKVEFFVVMSPSGDEGVMFKNEQDAKWTSTGKGGGFGVPTIGECFREGYAEGSKPLKLIRAYLVQSQPQQVTK